MERVERLRLLVLIVPAPKHPPTNAPPRLRFRIAVGLALAVLIGLILLILFDNPDKPEKKHAAPSEPTAQSTGPRISHGRIPSPRPPPGPVDRVPPSEEEEPLPVIDEIILEKEEVCEGEENLVTVRAHTVNNTDPWLGASELPFNGSPLLQGSWLKRGRRLLCDPDTLQDAITPSTVVNANRVGTEAQSVQDKAARTVRLR